MKWSGRWSQAQRTWASNRTIETKKKEQDVIVLNRFKTSDQGTFGTIAKDNQLFYTGELPWRDNRKKISCIPEGQYICKWVLSPRFGRVFTVTEVPDRSNILIHSGNWCGDVSLGWKSHILGCIILGRKFGTLQGQDAVLVSRPAITDFHLLMGEEDFILEVNNNGLF